MVNKVDVPVIGAIFDFNLMARDRNSKLKVPQLPPSSQNIYLRFTISTTSLNDFFFRPISMVRLH